MKLADPRFLLSLFSVLAFGWTALAEDAPKKVAVPDDEAQAASLKLVKEVYGDEYAKAKTIAGKQALAAKLLTKANETSDDPVTKFVLLRLARDVAAQAGDYDSAFEAIDSMADSYEVNAGEMKIAALTKAVATAKTADQQKALAEEAIQQAKAVAAGDDFTAAGRLAAVALAVARKARDKSLIAEAQSRVAEATRGAKAYEEVAAAKAALEKNAADPDSNAVVGKYLCFVKADWDSGLLMLARGSDEELKALAAKELGQAVSSMEQVKLGDAWWKAAEKEKAAAHKAMQDRAAYWYRRAVSGLSGLLKDKVEKRLAECPADAGQDPAVAAKKRVVESRTVVQPGNVLLGGKGITTEGVGHPECLFDGNTTNFDAYRGIAGGGVNKPWTIHLDKVYKLQEIRMLLWNQDSRSYRYTLEVSADDNKFACVADHSNLESRGWQKISFHPQRVKTIRMTCLHSSANAFFHVVELEAYCQPPKD